MTRPIQYACDPAARYCECGHCRLPAVRNIDLDRLAEFNRATYGAATFIILLAAFLAFMAIGFANTEEIHRKIVAERAV
ncbi:hypothetical protein B9J07_12860 [Sinorhizobium sp. LM21]|uniref:membrane protein n=1 Tax=Sinorhizobium phage phiLM21 TaxID=1524882 RepID=UPI0004E5DDCC|nr:membrane protein [Sinorhizobium phage phiLM21]AII27763.1 membrane protein [Sinorhizobium phage phiLM21]OWZ93527.1 hypothetical protein B9J07_12860 [Sinorhizobium sp. LM21]